MANGRGTGKTRRIDKPRRRKRAGEEEVIHTDHWEPGLRLGLKALSTASVSRAKLPEQVLFVALCHNLRRCNEQHKHKDPPDQSRTYLNKVLVGPDDPHEAAKRAADILEGLGVAARRVDQIMGIELVMQPPDGWDVPDFYRVCLEWAETRYEHVLSAVVHRDQVRPHLHVLALAVAGGKLAGAKLTSDANRLEEQIRLFMQRMRSTLGLRPDRQKAAPAAVAGGAVNVHGESTPDTPTPMLGYRAPLPAANLIAHQPHSPAVSRPDLMPTTSYWSAPEHITALFERGIASGYFPRTPRRSPSPAPRPRDAPSMPWGGAALWQRARA